MAYLLLAIAIVAEVVATSALKVSDGFTKWVPSAVSVLGYSAAFYCLSLVLKSIPIGVAYAVWAGMGILLITMVGAVVYKQIPDAPAVIGILLIVAGVFVIQVMSKTSVH